VQRLEVATDVFAEPEPVYDLLRSFTGYANYSEHLDDVVRHGDGGPGTEYDIALSWWRLSHTVRSEVTGVDPPNVVDWRLVSALDAHGSWLIDPATDTLSDAEPPADGGPVTRVRFVVEYDPGSVDADVLGLSRLVPMDTVIEKAKPKLREEVTAIVERVVEDLEGKPRPVDLEVRWGEE
jgi:hypothetical protein